MTWRHRFLNAGKAVFLGMMGIKIRLREGSAPREAAILMANHRSYIDVLFFNAISLAEIRAYVDMTTDKQAAATALSGNQRVIRLLLDGVAPARILALTYTKAAAANMATKVFDTLAGCAAPVPPSPRLRVSRASRSAGNMPAFQHEPPAVRSPSGPFG